VKKDTSSEFLHTFESYRTKTGYSISEACEQIGISRSMFYAIRDGRLPASDKLRSRLEVAMRDNPPAQRTLAYDAIPPESSARVREPAVPLTKAEVRVLIGEIKVRLDLLQMSFEDILDS
jgi:hypothetical protein